MKPTAIVFGVLAALFIVAQLVMGVLLSQGGEHVARLAKSHQHTGYVTFVVVIVYIGLSLPLILSSTRDPKRPRV